MTEHQLIPIAVKEMAGETVQTVDARTLHEFLKVDARFNDWIDRRISEYDFEEGKDFYSFLSKNRKTGVFGLGQGRPAMDYALSLDMAKELCMVERNEKGRQARRYFIACEKALREEAQPLPVLTGGKSQLAALLADTGGLNRAQEERLVKQLKLDAISRRPLRARVVQAVKWGWDWETLRESGNSKRRDLLQAVQDCLALGLIDKAPAGMPDNGGI